MNNTYDSLVQQTFNFPQEDFKLKNEYLQYNDVDIKALIDKHGTPLKLSYLPKIGMQINKAKKMFANAIKKHKYEGEYHYCYCTKSSHFSFIVEETLKHDIHLETSYAYDIDIINSLYKKRKLNKDIHIICNGFKQKNYTSRIAKLINDGFKNVIPVLDNKEELNMYKRNIRTGEPFKLGIRILKAAKGYYGKRKNVYTVAKNVMEKGLTYSYVGRKLKKREYRTLWIARINAAVREEGSMTYSQFINKLSVKGIDLNRKVLADLAMNEPETFKKLVDSVK